MYLNCEDYLNENCQKYKTNENDLHNVKPTSKLRTLLYRTTQECCHSLERTQEDIFRYHFRFPPEPQTLVQLLIGSFRSYPSLNSRKIPKQAVALHCGQLSSFNMAARFPASASMQKMANNPQQSSIYQRSQFQQSPYGISVSSLLFDSFCFPLNR